MTAVTPNFGWPIPTEDSNTELWDHIADLGNAADASVRALGTSVAFTPTLVDGAGTALSLGAGGSITGRHATMGKQHIIDVEIIRGGGAWVGSGSWIVGNLPINARSWWFVFGFGYITGKNLPITVVRVGGSDVGLLGPGGRLSNTYPAWSSGENIGFRVFYERS